MSFAEILHHVTNDLLAATGILKPNGNSNDILSIASALHVSIWAGMDCFTNSSMILFRSQHAFLVSKHKSTSHLGCAADTNH